MTQKTFQENLSDVLAQRSKEDIKRDETIISEIKNTLSTTPTGAALIQWADDYNIEIVIDHQMDPNIPGGYINGTVILCGQNPFSLLVGYTAHELRHAWQDTQGFVPQVLINQHSKYPVSPDEFIIRTLLIEADAVATQIQVLGELAVKAQKPKYWLKFVEDTNLYNNALRNFEESVSNNKETLDNKLAMQEAFTGWFTSYARAFYTERSLDVYIESITKALGHPVEHKNSVHPTELTKDVKIARNKESSTGIKYTDRDALESLFVTMDGQRYMPPLPEAYLNGSCFQAEEHITSTMSTLHQSSVKSNHYQAWELARSYNEYLQSQHKAPPSQKSPRNR